MTRSFRRVVTGHNAEGKSIILKDGPSPQTLEPLPQLFLHEMWETTAPADNTGEVDTAIRENSIEPHDPNGTIFRIVDFPPDEMWKDADVGAAFDEMRADVAMLQTENECLMAEMSQQAELRCRVSIRLLQDRFPSGHFGSLHAESSLLCGGERAGAAMLAIEIVLPGCCTSSMRNASSVRAWKSPRMFVIFCHLVSSTR